MTAVGEDAFDDLVEAILDGAPIDWEAAESTASAAERALLGRLRELAAVAEVHRSTGTGGEADPTTAGRRWGHLRVLELIGRGSSGSVYRAWDEKLDREVALKLLPARAADGAPPSDAMIEEGRMLARVRHPNVVTLYGADLIDGCVGLWMERVAGSTLDEIVRAGRRFTAREAAALGVELCRAVAAVHAAGVVHRDIKASNVMVADDGRPVLMDFGTGRGIDDGAAPLAGTPLYLAPELFQGGDASPRSDVYSIAVLLHHLLTGSYPVRADDLEGLRRAHRAGQRSELRSVRRDVPAKLASVLARALDPDPGRRHPSADALAADLDAISHPRSARAARAFAVAAAILLAAGGAWEVRNASTGRQSPSRTLLAALGVPLDGAASADLPAEPPAIVVLPFDDLGDQTDGEHFVDGLADEILRELARVDGLAVRSRHSSFSFRERPLDLRAIGERLHVNLAVTGSVRRSGDRLRVSAQLVDLAGDRALWADRFDRPYVSSRDVFAITDEIARSIVNALRLTLGTGQRRYDLDPETYDLYLRARALTDHHGAPAGAQAIELFERIIEQDPTFAPAYAGVANAYFARSQPAGAGGGMRFDTALAKMRDTAARALELDPLLAEAHAAMGEVYARELDWEAAERSFRRALELDPTSSGTYVRFSFSTLRPLGKNDEAERLLRIALEHDPLSQFIESEIAILYFCTGRFEEAVVKFESLDDVDDPKRSFTRAFLGRSLIFAGRVPEALALFEDMPGDPGDFYPAWYSLALVRAGRRAEAEALAIAHRGNSHRALFVNAALGDLDGAFEALERQVVEEPQRIPMILTYPELDVLHGDPRLAEIRRKFRLPA